MLESQAVRVTLNLHQLPNTSSVLPWHMREWKKIEIGIRDGLLPHALMLVGPQYVGKSQFALAVARRLLCNTPFDGLNCGQCHACVLSSSGSHGDFLWVEPEEKSRIIKIEQIRNLVRFSQKTATHGMRKVIVIDPAGSMNLNAFNALLKLLEEPANETFLILVCHRLDGIPVTIRSRCLIYRLGIPGYLDSLEWLDSFVSNRNESEAILALADNLPLLARDIYLAGISESMINRKATLDSLRLHTMNVTDAAACWSETDPVVLLEKLTRMLQQQVLELSTQQLNTKHGHVIFRIYDEITMLRRALSGGANLNKQMLIDAVISQYRRLCSTDSYVNGISDQYREGKT